MVLPLTTAIGQTDTTLTCYQFLSCQARVTQELVIKPEKELALLDFPCFKLISKNRDQCCCRNINRVYIKKMNMLTKMKDKIERVGYLYVKEAKCN